jgi:hypothetical protein
MKPVMSVLAVLATLAAGYWVGVETSRRHAEGIVSHHLTFNRDSLPDPILLQNLRERALRYEGIRSLTRRGNWDSEAAEEAVKASRRYFARLQGPWVMNTADAAVAWNTLMRSIEDQAVGMTRWDPRLIGFSDFAELRWAAMIYHNRDKVMQKNQRRTSVDKFMVEIHEIRRCLVQMRKEGWSRERAREPSWFHHNQDPVEIYDKTFVPALRTLPPDMISLVLEKLSDTLNRLDPILSDDVTTPALR